MKKRIFRCFGRVFIRSLLSVAVFAFLAFGAVIPAQAASGIEISTPYPGLTVNAGDERDFDLDFYNGTGSGQNVSLSVVSIPNGWKGYFEGGGSKISRVYLKNGENDEAATFKLSIPGDARNGTYHVELKAVTDNGQSDTLRLDLTISSEEAGVSSFTAQYPEQEGAAGTKFSFSTTIVNNSASEQTYSFSTNAPDGWLVSFKPGYESTQVASITVEPRKSQSVTVGVTPPENVEAGVYTISCAAVSADETLETQLTVKITGRYDIEISTPSGRLSTDAYAKKEKAVTLSISNNGNTDLQNVNLTSSAPSGWNVRFENPTLDILEAGSTMETTVYITPGEEAMSGDYVVKVTAKTAETSDSAEFRITVRTETIWGLVGVVIIVIICAGLAYIFHKYGRR